jgi:hypothetical protein
MWFVRVHDIGLAIGELPLQIWQRWPEFHGQGDPPYGATPLVPQKITHAPTVCGDLHQLMLSHNPGYGALVALQLVCPGDAVNGHDKPSANSTPHRVTTDELRNKPISASVGALRSAASRRVGEEGKRREGATHSSRQSKRREGNRRGLVESC